MATATTVQTSTSDPWAGLQPFLNGTQGYPGLFNEAANQFGGPAPRYYDNSTVAGIAPETNLAWNAATARGLGGSPVVQKAQNYTSNVLDGQYNDGGPYGNIFNTGGPSNPFKNPQYTDPFKNGPASNAFLNGQYNNSFQNPQYGDPFKSGPASEAFLNGKYSNAFLNGPQGDNLFKNIESRVRPAIDARFSAAGRYGSGLYADESARAITEAYAPVAYQGYLNDRQLEQQGYLAERGMQQQGYMAERGMQQQGYLAEKQLGQQGYLAERGMQQQGYLSERGMQQQGYLSASQLGQQGYLAERGMQQQAAQMAPTLAAQDYTDIGALEAVGQARQGYAQQLIGADQQRFDYNQNIPNQQLQRYAGLLSGQQTPPSSTSTTTQKQPSNLLGNIAGIGLSAAGIYGMLNG